MFSLPSSINQNKRHIHIRGKWPLLLNIIFLHQKNIWFWAVWLFEDTVMLCKARLFSFEWGHEDRRCQMCFLHQFCSVHWMPSFSWKLSAGPSGLGSKELFLSSLCYVVILAYSFLSHSFSIQLLKSQHILIFTQDGLCPNGFLFHINMAKYSFHPRSTLLVLEVYSAVSLNIYFVCECMYVCGCAMCAQLCAPLCLTVGYKKDKLLSVLL